MFAIILEGTIITTDWDCHDLLPITFHFILLQSLAEDLQSKAQSLGLRSEVVDLKSYEPEDSLSDEVHYNIVMSTVVRNH